MKCGYKGINGKYKDGWRISGNNGGPLTIETNMTNSGPISISNAKVTVFFIDANYKTLYESEADVIGGEAAIPKLLPTYTQKITFTVKKPPCDNCEPLPIITKLVFFGQG